jgi:polyhydroxybutyrate depolymerase
VVALHGKGGSADWMRTETRWDEWASAHGWAVVFPEAQPPQPERPPSFLTNPPTWHASADDPPTDLNWIYQLLDHLADTGVSEPQRVVVTGFSNGAACAFRLVAHAPTRFCACAPVAGYCRTMPRGPIRVPTLVLAGGADPLVPPHGGSVRLPWGQRLVERPALVDSLASWRTALGATGVQTWHEPPIDWHAFTGGTELRLGIIAGLGHHWPGGLGRLNARIGGPPSTAVDATQLLGAWFERVTQ